MFPGSTTTAWDAAGIGGWLSTTLGTTLHGMCHTSGLPHCKDSRCIMTRRFDRLNRFYTFSEALPGRPADFFPADSEAWFAPVRAARLRWSPWFQPEDSRPPQRSGTGSDFDAKKDTVTFEARAGIRVLGFWI